MDQSPAAKRAREDAVHHGDVAADPPELHWGPDYLHRLFGCLVERVPTLHRDDLIDYLQGLHQGWGSCCSGTDAPRFIYEAIQAWARSRNMTCTFIHILSAECDSAKQRFIQVTGQPRQLFGDLFDVCRDGAMNFITQQREAPDAANEIRVYYIGFSCKTVSGLASSHRTMNTIDDYLGTTGLTFSGLLSILECRQPRFLLAENVAGLTVGNQHVAVEEKLSAAGYVVFRGETHRCSSGCHKVDRDYGFWPSELICLTPQMSLSRLSVTCASRWWIVSALWATAMSSVELFLWRSSY